MPLQSAKKLDDCPDPIKKIRLKKDTHPAIRKEYGGLREVDKKRDPNQRMKDWWWNTTIK